LSELTARTKDKVVSFGELLSSKIISAYLSSINQQHQWIDSRGVIITDNNFGIANVDFEKTYSKINSSLNTQHSTLFLAPGFISSNESGITTTLGRGGSDYTATILGSSIKAEEIIIWTDIDGMHNNDPRVVDRTRPIAELSFDEAAELAYFGAKILHPASIWPAQLHNVPVRLLNTMDPAAAGTLIKAEVAETGVKAIAAKDGITAINIKSSRMLLAYGFLRRIFEVFEAYKTPIDMITTSEVAVSVTIDDLSHLDQIVEELRRFGTVEVDPNQAIICVVGNQVAETKGSITAVMDSLVDIPIRMVSFGGSKHNVSILVDAQYKVQALKSLNEGVFSW
jgi:aspartate kinase